MGNPNVHNHKRCPLILAGPRQRQIKGNRHLKAADGTPMANVMLTALDKLGVEGDQLRRQHGDLRSEWLMADGDAKG